MDNVGEKHLQKLRDLVGELYEKQREATTFMKFSDYFDDFFFPFASYVSPYLWILPLIPTITFKRAKLFGVTQKLILLTITTDMLFTLFTGIKDGLLYFLDLNYGFVEYKICRFFLISFRVQGTIHGSSLLLKSIMTARILGLFAFPIKFRNFRFTKWIILLTFFHVVVCAQYFSLALMVPIYPVTTVQMYKHGKPIKIIQACVIDIGNHDFHFLLSTSGIMFAVQFTYFLLIPVVFQTVSLVVLRVIMKRRIKAVENLVSDNRQRSAVKYVRLMKVPLFLGISFLIQEIPLIITNVYSFSVGIKTLSKFISISYNSMAISYSIGKPVDLLIYANQSEVFRKTLSKWLCRNRQPPGNRT
jgi:hypothetical protein